MVERPIKKSERQSQAKTDGDSSNSRVKSSGKPQRKEAKGKGKKASLKDESKPPINPALARPPKPPKPKAEPEQEAEPEVEVELHQLMFEAGRARIHADRLGYEWSVTKPLMDKGLAAFKAGDYEQARALYQEVKNQSLLAIEQSYYADIHWQLLIPIND